MSRRGTYDIDEHGLSGPVRADLYKMTWGRLTLVAGTATGTGDAPGHGSNASVFPVTVTPGGTAGFLRGTVNAAGDVVITSSSGTDTSVVDYLVIG